MASVGDVTTTLRADLGPLRASLAQGGQQVQGFARTVDQGIGTTAATTIPRLNRLENAVSNFGLGLAGVQGPLQKVTEVLGAAAIGGGAFALGVVVIGGLVKQFEYLKIAADQSADAIKRAADQVVYLDESERQRAKRQLAEAKATRAELLKELVTPGGPYGDSFGERAREAVNRFQAGLRSTAAINKDLTEVNRLIVTLGASIIEMDKKTTKPLEDQTAAWSKLSGEIAKATQTAVEAAAIPDFLKSGTSREFDDGTAPGFTTEPFNPTATPRILLGARQREQILEQADREQAQWQGIGDHIGDIIGEGLARGLARSILGESKSLGDAFKNVFHAILEELMVEIIRPWLKKLAAAVSKALAGEGGGGGGNSLLGGALGFAAGGPVGGLLGGFGGLFGLRAPETVVVQVAQAPVPHPLVLARDAYQQSLWMETGRVLEGMGVRLRVVGA